MTPSPPSTNQSPSTSTFEPQVAAGPNNDQHRIVRKRNRVPLSCAPCRTRKLKCNRSSPCENCIKRGDAASCSYAAPGARRKTSGRASQSGSPDDMQNRIDRLEGLVLSLMTNGDQAVDPSSATRTMSLSTGSNSQAEFTPPQGSEEHFREDDSVESETDKVAKSFGVLHFANNKAMYLSDTHWATILHEISEVKNFFQDHKRQFEDALKKVEAARKQAGMQYTGPAFLLGGKNIPQLSELLASLPGRDAVDKMVQRYFTEYDPSTHILHPPSWHRQYDRHWQDPEATNPAFLGQLFAICGLAMQSYHKNQDEPYEFRGRALSLSANYRSLTSQCLLLVDFTKPEQTAIETMVLHLHSEYQKTGDVDIGLWVLIGMIGRLSMRMGLHRDSKNFPHLTFFQGEMRRRLWTFVRQADILFSFAVGLPAMIRSGDTDTDLPSNIKDEDFDEDTQVPPVPRPNTDFTPVSYLIAKSDIAFIFGRIAEFALAVQLPQYDEVMKLDNELKDAYHSLSPILHLKPIEESQMDTATTMTMRMNISLLYNKGLCVLHRRFLTRARDNSRYSHSRQSCIDASLTLLRNQTILHAESQPGKRMHRSQYQISSIMTHDFILAATLIALDLWYSVQAEASGRSTGDIELWGHDRKEEMMVALENARAIWDELKDRYVEAFKAFHIVGVMLQKIQAIRAQTAARMAQGAFQYAASAAGKQAGASFGQSDDEKPEHSAAITLGLLSSGAGGAPGEWKPEPYPLTPQSNGNSASAGASTSGGPSTGLTPNWAAADASMGGMGASPFSFFGGVEGDMNANLDWNAWDQYIQNPNIEPLAGDMWAQPQGTPQGDFSGLGGLDAQGGQQQGGGATQLNSNLFANNPALLPPGTTL